MEYSVYEIAEICNITVANAAYRLNKLGLKSPHTEEHLKAVQNYLIKDKKQTLYQMVKQRYGDTSTDYYQGYSYRWRKLGKPDIKTLDELDDLWNKRISDRREHAREYKEYNRHINPSDCLAKKTQKLRHMFDWISLDKDGVFDDEVKYWYLWYLDSGYKSCAARRLAYLEVLHIHHVIDTDEYFEAKESKTKLKVLLY